MLRFIDLIQNPQRFLALTGYTWDEFRVVLPFAAMLVFIAVMLVSGYMIRDGQEQKKKVFWSKLALKNHLTFQSRSLLNNTQVHGDYRGYWLTLDTITKSIWDGDGPTSSQLYTRIVLQKHRSPKKQPVWQDEDIVDKKSPLEDILHRLTAPQSPALTLRGTIYALPQGSRLLYEQPGLETEEHYLQTLFALLCELADLYPAIVALGGEAVPGLRGIATNQRHKLRPLATQLLKDIGQDTALRLGSHISDLWCPRCRARVLAHTIRLAWWNQITYYGCRRCGRSRDLLDSGQQFYGSLI
jgi:hypothetical protein